MDLEKQLRAGIENSGMTQYQLAKLSGVDQAQISYFMSGQRTLTLAPASKILEVLRLELKPKGGVSMQRHKYRNNVPTATFEELNFKEQSQSITASINSLERMINSHIRRAREENRNSDLIRQTRLNQVQRMIRRMGV